MDRLQTVSIMAATLAASNNPLRTSSRACTTTAKMAFALYDAVMAIEAPRRETEKVEHLTLLREINKLHNNS